MSDDTPAKVREQIREILNGWANCECEAMPDLSGDIADEIMEKFIVLPKSEKMLD